MQFLHCGLALLLSGLVIIPWTAEAAEPAAPGAMRADPALIQFVQSVVESNPRVQAARAALEASGAFRDAASRPLYNPELSVDAENTDVETRTVGISQTLDWGGKRKARAAVAESDRLVVEAEYLAARWDITVELLDGLAQHQTGEERDALAESRQQRMDEFAALAQRRFDAGDLAQVELDLARLASTDARIRKATAGAGSGEPGVLDLSQPSPEQRPLPPGTMFPTGHIEALLHLEHIDQGRRGNLYRVVGHQRHVHPHPLCGLEQYLPNHPGAGIGIDPYHHRPLFRAIALPDVAHPRAPPDCRTLLICCYYTPGKHPGISC